MKEKFDGILFGNGMTLNLLNQLKPYASKDKLYLFNIDEFLKRFVENKISPREENLIFNTIYKKRSMQNEKYFSKIKEEFRKYYSCGNNANIEYFMGCDLFKGNVEYDEKLIKNMFPAIYNIWFNILYQYLIQVGLYSKINNFYISIRNSLITNQIYTTNFDYMADDILSAKHLHGYFQWHNFKFAEICLPSKEEGKFRFKCLWGWNGMGKIETINDFVNDGYSGIYFDLDFFYDPNIKIDNLLIYGLGFQRAGYITEEFLKAYPRYNTELVGSFIDDHILERVLELQNLKQLNKVTVAYYEESEKEHFKKLFDYYNIKNVTYEDCNKFDFKI